MDFITEKKVLALLLQRPKIFQACVEHIDKKMFDLEPFSIVAGVMIDIQKQFPTMDLTRQVIAAELMKRRAQGVIKDDIFPECVSAFEELIVPHKDLDYFEKHLEKMVIERRLEETLKNAIAGLHTGQFDEIVVSVADAVEGSRFRIATTSNYHSLIEDRQAFFQRIEELNGKPRETGISCGIDALDNRMFFSGCNRKELLIFCAPPGRGKTNALIGVIAAAMLRGQNGIGYTLETDEHIYKLRFHAALTGIPVVELQSGSAELLTKRWEMIEKHVPKPGRITLGDFPVRGLRPNAIRADIRRHRDRGVEIDYVTVDYADIMANNKRFSMADRRFATGEIYEDLRGIAKEENVAIFTASQGNRGSLNKIEIDINDLAEDFSKAMTADYVIGLSQTRQEGETRTANGLGTGKMRLFLAKNRNGDKHVSVPIFTDYVRARMSMEEWAKFDEEVFGIPNPIRR